MFLTLGVLYHFFRTLRSRSFRNALRRHDFGVESLPSLVLGSFGHLDSRRLPFTVSIRSKGPGSALPGEDITVSTQINPIKSDIADARDTPRSTFFAINMCVITIDGQGAEAKGSHTVRLE